MKKTKDTIKYYLEKRDIEKMGKEFIDSIREAEEYFDSMSRKMGEIRIKYELDYIVDDLRKNKVKSVSTAMLQKRYKIGYSKSSRYMDALEKNKIIVRGPEDSFIYLLKNISKK